MLHVLTEEEKNGCFEGLSDEYIRVYLKGEDIQRGKIYLVRIYSLTEDGLSGIAERMV